MTNRTLAAAGTSGVGSLTWFSWSIPPVSSAWARRCGGVGWLGRLGCLARLTVLGALNSQLDFTMLEFEGRKYMTIADVLDRFPVSEKKIKKLIGNGELPPAEEIEHGTRRFRHYPESWTDALAKLVKPRKR